MPLTELTDKIEPFTERLLSSMVIEVVIIFIVVVLAIVNTRNFRKYKVRVNLFDLFYIAGINLMVRRTRSIVTVIGMSIGIASIVFLVSIGYGLQDMVISQATRLEELKHIEVSPQQGSRLKLNDIVLNDLRTIPNVEKTLPMVAIVGDLSYQSSNAAIPVYGVTTDYLRESALQPVYGKLYESEQLYNEVGEKDSTDGENAEEVSGEESEDTQTNRPFQGNASLLEQPIALEDSEFVELETESVTGDIEKVKEIKLPDSALREIVVNKAALEIIGLKDEDAVGEKVKVSFTITGNNLTKDGIKVVSYPETFVITGVLQDSAEPAMYTPFYNIRMLGVINFSEIRVIANNQDNVPYIREQIESQGYLTSSVLDTISEIEQLFSSLRVGLGLIGAFGLAIASLGMFNTLTVSLLERTREIGLMKTIGMKSGEVRLLFLIESLLMGLLGGISGLVIGFLGGEVISLILTSYSLSRGGDVINISSVPLGFIVLVVALSVLVGYVTGIFPARRATRISALNALRYE